MVKPKFLILNFLLFLFMQVWATAVGVGPNAVNLSGSYSNTSKFDYQDELGQLVLRVCSTVPHGILCFFPSYRLLDVVIERLQILIYP